VRVSLEFFGPISDRMRGTAPDIEIATAPRNAGALADYIARALPGGENLKDPHLRMAINDTLANRDDIVELANGDRIAFLSPFSGG